MVVYSSVCKALSNKTWLKFTIFANSPAALPVSSMSKKVVSKDLSVLKVIHFLCHVFFYKFRTCRRKWLTLFSNPVLCARKHFKWDPRFFNCATNCSSVGVFLHLGHISLQLLHSYHEPCLSEYYSNRLNFPFSWTSMSLWLYSYTNSFYFYMMDWTVLYENNKAWVIVLLQTFLPDLSTLFYNIRDAVFSLIFSNRPLRPLQNCWIYTEMIWLTCLVHYLTLEGR